MKKIMFDDMELLKCFEFANNMRGKHNPDMIMKRSEGEIFRDDFRGKLGEIAFCKYLKESLPILEIQSEIDFSITPRGQWDIVDLVINGMYINVKSIRQRSEFLMVETFRYDADGNYVYKNNDNNDVRVDAYALMRVTIDPDINPYRVETYKYFKKYHRNIYAEFLGIISHTDFWENKHFAQQGIKCDKKTLVAVCNNHRYGIIMNNINDLPKNQVLQKDNYILHYKELSSLDNFEWRD